MVSPNSAIKSICLKCGKEGFQEIYYKPSSSNPQRAYLRMNHGKDGRCFVGRVHSLTETIEELALDKKVNKPKPKRKPSIKEYEATIQEIIKFAHTQIDRKYGHGGPITFRRLKEILDRHDLWNEP